MELTAKNIIVIQWGVVIGASLIAAVSDLRARRIPNLLCGPLFAAGLIWAAWQGGVDGLGNAAAASVVLAVPFVILFIFAGGGAGDAKLMGAIGAWLGWKQGIIALLCVCIAGVVLALGKAAVKKRLKFVLANVCVSVYTFLVFVLSGRIKYCGESEPESLQKSSRSDDLTIPYGVAIFAGVCLAGGYVLLW